MATDYNSNSDTAPAKPERCALAVAMEMRECGVKTTEQEAAEAKGITSNVQLYNSSPSTGPTSRPFLTRSLTANPGCLRPTGGDTLDITG